MDISKGNKEMKRSGKFYRRNEAEVMKELGFEPTPNSGSGWIVKEDGVSENCICQLKSTDAQSIKVNLLDIHKLEYNAGVEYKLPVFAIQFLSTNEVYLLIKPKDLQEVSHCLNSNKGINPRVNNKTSYMSEYEPLKARRRKTIRSTDEARQELRTEMSNKYNKKGRSAT